jgi:hypothetical protein
MAVMMDQAITLEEVVNLAKQLSSIDKVRLIEQIVPEIERDLIKRQDTSRQSLRGLWQGVEITDEEIAEARAEMWVRFPREDI